MAEILTEFTPADMVHGVTFTIPDDGGMEYEVYVNESKSICIFPKGSNDLTARVEKVTKKGFYWSKNHFGTRITGIHPWTAIRKVEDEKEVPNG